jgi:putative DNA primase/helicase
MLKFLYEIVEPEEVEKILDFFAYCLWRDYKFHNWMLLNGFGQNGKSTLLYFLEQFLGSNNVSADSLQRILKRNFSSAQLYGKLANIDADLSAEALTNTGLLKKLTGGDRLTAEFKYKPLFDFLSYANLIFSANEIPMSADMTDAFYRRLIIINFTHQFFGDKDDPNLKFKITTEEENSGFLRLLLKRLPRVLKDGIRTTTNEAIKKTQEQYLMSANPMKFFVDKALNPIAKNDKLTPKSEMYDGYLRFCRHYGLAVESEQSFSRKLTEDYGFHYAKHRIHKGQDGVWCWDDVKLSDYVGTSDASQTIFEELEEEKEKEQEQPQNQPDDPNTA